MAISYPVTLPSTPNFRAVEFRAKNAVAVSSSPFTYQQQIYQYPGQMWEVDVSLPPMKRNDAETWIAALMSLNGSVGTFKLGDPVGCYPRGSANVEGLFYTVSELSSGDNQLEIFGAGLTTNSLLAGDYIEIGNQLFKCLNNAVEKDAEQPTINVDVWPNVRGTIEAVSSVKVAHTKGLFRLASNQFVFSSDELAHYGISFSAIEAL